MANRSFKAKQAKEWSFACFAMGWGSRQNIKAIKMMMGMGTPRRNSRMDRMKSLRSINGGQSFQYPGVSNRIALTAAPGGAQTAHESAQQQGNE